MSDGTFACHDLTTFCRLDELGLVVTGQRLERDRSVLACRVVDAADDTDQWCRRCGGEGLPRDRVVRRLAHEPLGWRPTTLVITVIRYRCIECGHVWRQDTSAAASARAKISRRGLRWALEGLVVGHLSVARIANGLGVAWNTANDAVLAEGKKVLIAGPARFDAVEVIGVDEHVWRHTRKGDKYVTVIIDLTPMVRLAGDALDRCRRRVQQELHGHRGRASDPLYRSRRALHTGADLLTDRQVDRLTTLFGTEDHVEVETTWGVYQRLIQAYRHQNKTRGRELMAGLIETVSSGVPAALIEVVTLGRTLKKRADDVLAYFERPGTSNGPTEAINGRLEHLRGTALGFRNLTNYIARSLLEAGGFRPLLHPAL